MRLLRDKIFMAVILNYTSPRLESILPNSLLLITNVWIIFYVVFPLCMYSFQFLMPTSKCYNPHGLPNLTLLEFWVTFVCSLFILILKIRRVILNPTGHISNLPSSEYYYAIGVMALCRPEIVEALICYLLICFVHQILYT